MNAVSLYVSTAKMILQADAVDEQRVHEVTRLLQQLRALLACVVCSRLLCDPYVPRSARCQHNVCRLCVRGTKSLRSPCAACRQCQDYKAYDENRQMRFLLPCYKSLCEQLMASALFAQLSKQKTQQPLLHCAMSTQEIVHEGASYDDILSSFSFDLPPRLHMPTVSFAPLPPEAPPAAMHVFAHTQPASKVVSAPTPAQAPPTTTNTSKTTFVPAPLIKVESIAAAPVPAVPQPVQHVTVPQPTQHVTVPQSSQHVTVPQPSQHVIVPQSSQHVTVPQSSQHVIVPQASKQPVTFPAPPPTAAPAHTHMLSNLSLKNLKSLVELSNAGQLSSSSGSGTPAPTITYVGAHQTPGVVVSMMSSSATTAAPLTIASSKLQSLNRHLAQARNAFTITPTSIAANSLSSNATNASNLPSVAVSNAPQLTIKVSLAPGLHVPASGTTAMLTTTAATATPITTTTAMTASAFQQLRQPPSIKTVSNGSSMYSVLYTGIGNKITIKRKPDGEEENGQRVIATDIFGVPAAPLQQHTLPLQKNAATLTPPLPVLNVNSGAANANSNATASVVFHQLAKTTAKRRGCRCGNATPTPGKLTCCGQRCPCYVDSKSCIGCKCRGCRNPHRPDGGKVRPVIPELACYEIQMADESASLSPRELPIVSLGSSTPLTGTTTMSTTLQAVHERSSPLQHTLEEYSMSNNATIGVGAAPPTSSSVTNTTTLIPFRSLQQHITTMPQAQPQQPQPQQQQQTLHSAGGMVQLEHLQRESVLIQNAEGKYQVVNVFTTGGGGVQNAQQQLAALQRLHAMPQLQTPSAGNNNSNNNNSSIAINNASSTTTTFLLPNSANAGGTSASTPSMVPQLLLQQFHQQQQQLNQQQQQLNHHNNQQQQQQQHHQQQHIQIHNHQHIQQRITTSSSSGLSNTSHLSSHQQQSNTQAHLHTHQPQQPHHNNNLATASISLQLQQQLKQNNIITVHPISASSAGSHQPQMLSTSASQAASAGPPAATITLSPIIVSSEMYGGGGAGLETTDDFGATLHHGVGTLSMPPTSRIVSISAAQQQSATTLTYISGGVGGGGLTTSGLGVGAGGGSVVSVGAAHLTPAMIEVIDSNDVRLLSADGFANY